MIGVKSMRCGVDNLLCCPYCQGNLVKNDYDYICLSCGCNFYIYDGIPSFLPEGLGKDYSLTMEQKNLNLIAAEVGWKRAVLDHFQEREINQNAFKYSVEDTLSEARADFRYLLPFKRSDVVMNLGNGWGNVACAFARSVEQVISIDTDLDRLNFVRIRAEQEKLFNITTIHGDVCELPVKENSIDIALMIGVFESVAGSRPGDPHYFQQLALNRVRKALKPGGYLYLATENRISLKYFLGTNEPHTGLRFISLFPHFLANIYSRLSRKTDFKEVTYSKPELITLLRKTGYQDIQFYYPIPNYQNLRFITPLSDHTSVMQLIKSLKGYPKFIRPLSTVFNLTRIFPTSVLQFVWPSFCIVAK